MFSKSTTFLAATFIGLGTTFATAAERPADHRESKRTTSVGGKLAIDLGGASLVIGGASRDGRGHGRDDFFVDLQVGPSHHHGPPAGQRWVPAHYEDRKVRVLVEPAHYEDRHVQVLVARGHFDERHSKVLVAPGHFEERKVRVLAVPGHFEVRTVPAVYQTIHDPWGNCRQVLVRPACHERVWVPDQYTERCERVWVPDQFETRCEKIWVPDQYETRCQRVLVPDRYEERCERVLVPGRWEAVSCGQPRRW